MKILDKIRALFEPDSTKIHLRLYIYNFDLNDKERKTVLQYSLNNRDWNCIRYYNSKKRSDILVTKDDPWYNDFCKCNTLGELYATKDKARLDPYKNRKEYSEIIK